MPTPILVVVERIDAGRGVKDVRHEVDQRVAKGKVTGWSASVLAEALADDLISDEVRWNAARAEDLLQTLWPASQDALQSALVNGDTQARILAARILRRLCAKPSDDLLWACVQDLQNDTQGIRWYIALDNAWPAARYLVDWGERSEPFIKPALSSEDGQQRLFAAAVAGFAGMEKLLDLSAPILIEHLRDNSVSGDAKLAAPALYSFGPAAIPYPQEQTNSDDTQLQAIVRAIIERLTYPQRPLDKLEDPMPRITQTTHDPLERLRMGSSSRPLRWRVRKRK